MAAQRLAEQAAAGARAHRIAAAEQDQDVFGPGLDAPHKLVPQARFARARGRRHEHRARRGVLDRARQRELEGAELGLAPDEPTVVLNSSGAFGAAKLWPDESFAALAVRIVRELGHAALVLCGPAERERAARIARLASHARVRSLADQPLSVGLSKACVRRAHCLVSTDSGPRHFGAAFGVPVVSLFGPTDVAWSDTHYAGEIHLQKQVPCGPCGQRECPEGHHTCMRDLSVGEVFAAVSRAVATAGAR